MLIINSPINAQVGIGEENPLQDLHISDSIETKLLLEADSLQLSIGIDASTTIDRFYNNLPLSQSAYFISEPLESIISSAFHRDPMSMIIGTKGQTPLYLGSYDSIGFSIFPDYRIYLGSYNDYGNSRINITEKTAILDKISFHDLAIPDKKFDWIYENGILHSNPLSYHIESPNGLILRDTATGSFSYARFDMQNRSLTLGDDSESSDEMLNIHGNIFIKDTLLFNEDNTISWDDNDLNFRYYSNLNFIGDSVRASRVFFTNEDSTWLKFDGRKYEIELKGDASFKGNKVKYGFNEWDFTANMKFTPFLNYFIDNVGGYDTRIMSNGVEYVRFEGESRRVRIGLGSGQPEADLEVVGKVKMDSLLIVEDAGIGKVLMSDDHGNATWQEIPEDEDWEVIGTNLKMGTSGTIQLGSSMTAPTSKVAIEGSVSYPITTIASTTHVLLPDEYTVIFPLPGTNVTLPLPSSAKGRKYHLKFQDNSVSNGLQTTMGFIEGAPTFTIPLSPYGLPGNSVIIQSDGLNWYVINM